MKRLRQPRCLYRLLALLKRGFWIPCALCGRYWGSWEWEKDGYPRQGPVVCVDSSDGGGLCTECAEHAAYRGAPGLAVSLEQVMALRRAFFRRKVKEFVDYGWE